MPDNQNKDVGAVGPNQRISIERLVCMYRRLGRTEHCSYCGEPMSETMSALAYYFKRKAYHAECAIDESYTDGKNHGIWKAAVACGKRKLATGEAYKRPNKRNYMTREDRVAAARLRGELGDLSEIERDGL